MKKEHLICMLIISEVKNLSTIEQTLDYIDSKRYTQTREEYLFNEYNRMSEMYHVGIWYAESPTADKYFNDARLYELN